MIGAFQSNDLATCIISKVRSKKEEFEYIPENYTDILKSQFSTENINFSQIDINNTLVSQFIISNHHHTQPLTNEEIFLIPMQFLQVAILLPIH